MAQPLRAVNARMCQSRASSASSAAAITPDAAAAATVTTRSSRLRFIRSATAPETAPRKKNGAIATADAAAVTNAEPVISNTSQPVTTQFIPTAADCSSTHNHSSRKSGNSNERAHLGPITPVPRLVGLRRAPGCGSVTARRGSVLLQLVDTVAQLGGLFVIFVLDRGIEFAAQLESRDFPCRRTPPWTAPDDCRHPLPPPSSPACRRD